jgi:hypothetical protein
MVRVRQLPSGKEQAPLRGHSGTIIDVFFSGDGRFAVFQSTAINLVKTDLGYDPHQTMRIVSLFFPREQRE